MVAGQLVHGYSSTYLIRGTEKTLLIDSGHPVDWAAVEHGLHEVLGDRDLDMVLPTHAELPHAGNLRRLLTAYPHAVTVGDVRDYHLYYPEFADRLQPMPVGTLIELGGGLEVEVVDGLIRDLPNTVWAYERSRRILFVADGFAYLHRPELSDRDEATPYHLPGECYLKVSELDEFPTMENAQFFTTLSLYWSRYVDNSAELYRQLDSLLESHPTDLVAPAHGSVIDELDDMVPLMAAAHRAAFQG